MSAATTDAAAMSKLNARRKIVATFIQNFWKKVQEHAGNGKLLSCVRPRAIEELYKRWIGKESARRYEEVDIVNALMQELEDTVETGRGEDVRKDVREYAMRVWKFNLQLLAQRRKQTMRAAAAAAAATSTSAPATGPTEPQIKRRKTSSSSNSNTNTACGTTNVISTTTTTTTVDRMKQRYAEIVRMGDVKSFLEYIQRTLIKGVQRGQKRFTAQQVRVFQQIKRQLPSSSRMLTFQQLAAIVGGERNVVQLYERFNVERQKHISYLCSVFHARSCGGCLGSEDKRCVVINRMLRHWTFECPEHLSKCFRNHNHCKMLRNLLSHYERECKHVSGGIVGRVDEKEEVKLESAKCSRGICDTAVRMFRKQDAHHRAKRPSLADALRNLARERVGEADSRVYDALRTGIERFLETRVLAGALDAARYRGSRVVELSDIARATRKHGGLRMFESSFQALMNRARISRLVRCDEGA